MTGIQADTEKISGMEELCLEAGCTVSPGWLSFPRRAFQRLVHIISELFTPSGLNSLWLCRWGHIVGWMPESHSTARPPGEGQAAGSMHLPKLRGTFGVDRNAALAKSVSGPKAITESRILKVKERQANVRVSPFA